MKEESLIAEYERLRRREDELVEEINIVDARLIEIEHQLPSHYNYPGDPPLDSDPGVCLGSSCGFCPTGLGRRQARF